MASIVARLFRNPEAAALAVQRLKERGFPAKDIGILVRQEAAPKALSVNGEKAMRFDLPQVGPMLASGPLASALALGSSPLTSLASALGLPEEGFGYYQLGLSLGGLLVSIAAPEGKVEQVKRIFRSAAAEKKESQSPGFHKAGRMTETNPLDAKMTGDFRRY